MLLPRFERAISPYAELLMDRFRASVLRVRGARLGAFSRVSCRCSVDRPWRLEIGQRCEIEHDVYIKITSDRAFLRLGSQVLVGRGVEFDISSSLTIGDHTLIAPGCFITDHNHNTDFGRTISSQGCTSTPVTIGDDVWLGANVVVLPGVTIGSGAVVGAGAVVNKNVESMSIVAGVPAHVIGYRKGK